MHMPDIRSEFQNLKKLPSFICEWFNDITSLRLCRVKTLRYDQTKRENQWPSCNENSQPSCQEEPRPSCHENPRPLAVRTHDPPATRTHDPLAMRNHLPLSTRTHDRLSVRIHDPLAIRTHYSLALLSWRYFLVNVAAPLPMGSYSLCSYQELNPFATLVAEYKIVLNVP